MAADPTSFAENRIDNRYLILLEYGIEPTYISAGKTASALLRVYMGFHAPLKRMRFHLTRTE
jgi:hypothetical protein